ncbi:MAG UNVERIFIED_CONTAM: DUF1501 domain-containing protein [Planctomycetaceae bacterium]
MSHFVRRHWMQQQVFGLAGVAAAWVQGRLGAGEPPKPALEPVVWNLQPKPAAERPVATAMISMFMQGGPSHIDLFDPKPELNRLHMQTYTGSIKYDNAGEASSRLFGCPWRFRRYGECGMDFSEPAAALGAVADDLCMIRSMHTGVNNHGESINALNTGRQLSGRPALGAWLTFALGSRNSRLPGFLVLTDPSGLPVLGVENWQNGWLPSIYQGTVVRPQEPRILNLDPPPQLAGSPQAQMLRLIAELNQRQLSRLPGESDLSARMQSYELAAGMQTAARDALDITQETQATQKLYGLDNDQTRDYGTRCLIARRLVERGVRFVQLHTGNQTWDHHGGIVKGLPAVCARTIPRRRLLSRTSNSAVCLTAPSFTGEEKWGGCRLFRTKRTLAAITIPTGSASGWPAVASAVAISTGPLTKSDTKPSPTLSITTTTTPPCCTCWD